MTTDYSDLIREAEEWRDRIRERFTDPLGHGYDLKEATKHLSRITTVADQLADALKATTAELAELSEFLDRPYRLSSGLRPATNYNSTRLMAEASMELSEVRERAEKAEAKLAEANHQMSTAATLLDQMWEASDDVQSWFDAFIPHASPQDRDSIGIAWDTFVKKREDTRYAVQGLLSHSTQTYKERAEKAEAELSEAKAEVERLREALARIRDGNILTPEQRTEVIEPVTAEGWLRYIEQIEDFVAKVLNAPSESKEKP